MKAAPESESESSTGRRISRLCRSTSKTAVWSLPPIGEGVLAAEPVTARSKIHACIMRSTGKSSASVLAPALAEACVLPASAVGRSCHLDHPL